MHTLQRNGTQSVIQIVTHSARPPRAGPVTHDRTSETEYGECRSFGNELPSLSSGQRSIPNGTADITHVADDVTSSQASITNAKWGGRVIPMPRWRKSL
eukprot:4779819-Prymnesium_polylepis.2